MCDRKMCYYLPPVYVHTYDICTFEVPNPQKLLMPLGSWRNWPGMCRGKRTEQ